MLRHRARLHGTPEGRELSQHVQAARDSLKKALRVARGVSTSGSSRVQRDLRRALAAAEAVRSMTPLSALDDSEEPPEVTKETLTAMVEDGKTISEMARYFKTAQATIARDLRHHRIAYPRTPTRPVNG